eukprot:9286956-Pyramimonas_sp.AAC.1
MHALYSCADWVCLAVFRDVEPAARLRCVRVCIWLAHISTRSTCIVCVVLSPRASHLRSVPLVQRPWHPARWRQVAS